MENGNEPNLNVNLPPPLHMPSLHMNSIPSAFGVNVAVEDTMSPMLPPPLPTSNYEVNGGTMPTVEAPRMSDRNVLYRHSNHRHTNRNRVSSMEYGVGLPLHQNPNMNMNQNINELSNQVGYGAVRRSAFNVADIRYGPTLTLSSARPRRQPVSHVVLLLM